MKLDHIHLVVKARPAAVRWLGEAFELVPAPNFWSWAKAAGAPVFLMTKEGEHALALFEGEQTVEGDHTVAFRMEADAFFAFAQRAEKIGAKDRYGRPLQRTRPVDHDNLAFSYYLVGPEGYRFEATCYDVGGVRTRLAKLA